jgi:TolB-like protein
MKKILFMTMFLFCLVFSAFAQTKPTIAILPFTGGAMEDGETIAELFSFDQTLNSVFSPIPRTSINSAIRREQNFQMSSGMTDPETISRIGHQLGARYIVAGTITNLGSQRLLVIAIMRIDNLQQISGDWRSYTDIGEIQDKLPEMAKNIIDASRKDTSRLPRLAVLPFQTPRSDREADTLSQILAVEIVRSGKYAVYPRTKTLEQVQKEYRNQLNGDTADDQAIAIGRGDNPLLALSGAVRSLGANRRMFNAAVINVESGVQTRGDFVNFDAIEEGLISMRVLAGKLTGVDLTVYDYTTTTAEEFMETINRINLQGGGNYTITINGDFEINREITFATNAQKTINLRGDNRERTISRRGEKVLFTVPKGITLVLGSNLRLTSIWSNSSKERIVLVTEDGFLRMEMGATISGSSGGGVYIQKNATFVMDGGTISGNSADNTNNYSGSSVDNYKNYDGGGIYVYEGTFTMSGGTITGNRARSDGGGVCVKSGTFRMTGGIISENKAFDGGGINISGTFILSGGSISNNSAENGGGGVDSSGNFIMNGGSITNNYAGTVGGGSGVYNGDVFVKTGGTIANNTGSRNVGTQVRSGYNNVRNSAAGTSVNLDSRKDGRDGGWERGKW